MKRVVPSTVWLFLLIGLLSCCSSNLLLSKTRENGKSDSLHQMRALDAAFYEELAQELLQMAALDQEWNQMVVDGVAESRKADFDDRKAEVYARNTARAKEIFDRVGYPSSHLVGSAAEHSFWIVVQHSDAQPDFQERVAKAMHPVVLAKGAAGERLAMLVDRVRINTGRPQWYGSQVQYDPTNGRAMPKALADSRGVDARRFAVGLEPLWKYMNGMSELQFMMNESVFQELGIAQPWSYPEGYLDWEHRP